MNSELAVRAPRSAVTEFVRVRTWSLVVWTAMLGWSAALFAIVRHDYLNFRLARFDLGNMVQAVWSTARGRPLETTLATGEQAVRFAAHVDPILVLFAPLWIVVPSPLTLAGVQIAVSALGALPVFWLGRRHLGSEKTAALMALAYLAYPWLAWTVLDAMHPVTLATPLLLFCVWYLDSDRLLPFSICAALVLATGELLGLTVVALGLWYAFARGRRPAGLLIGCAGAAWTMLCLQVVIPAFNNGAGSQFYERFETVGGSPGGLLETAVTDPGTILSALTTGDDVSYVVWLAAPLVGSFLLGPALAAVALPQLLVNLLSDLPTSTDPRHHYIGPVLPFLLAGSVVGLARLSERGRLLAAGLVLATSVSISLIAGPWPGAPGVRPISFHWTLPATHVDALNTAVALVPEDAAVSTTNVVGSQLSARRYIYSVPVVRRADWIVVDSWNAWLTPSKERKKSLHPLLLRRFLDRIDASPQWSRVFEKDGVLVYRRVSPE